MNSWEEQGRLYQQFELCEGSLQELAETENNIPERLIWGYLVDLLQVPPAFVIIVVHPDPAFYLSADPDPVQTLLSQKVELPVSFLWVIFHKTYTNLRRYPNPTNATVY